jgi:hypothetical protein
MRLLKHSRDKIPRAHLLMIALMILTVFVYWPALYGGYVFDDMIYFVGNADVHVTTLHLGDWFRAAMAHFGLNPLVRPLGSLTFAANYYFSGLDPFWPKLTNVGIHLLNGWLLYWLLRELFAFYATVRDKTPPSAIAAATIAGIWLLLPINFTGDAYVSQRMEAMATTFVFIGLAWYIRARREHYMGTGNGRTLWLILALCTGLGLTAKEDAALLPAFSACLEFALTSFRDRNGRFSRAALWTHFFVLIVPMLAGLAWMLPRMLPGVAWTRRFTLAQRLLTEPRVIWDYINWTLLPNLESLTFYHDDLKVSSGLFDPPTTALAILALLALLGAAVWQRKTRPLFCLGILWFFAGHSMTATVIPLELVFEHRNYFPSVGLLLAAAALLALEPGLQSAVIKGVVTAAFVAFIGSTTLGRAQEWSHPIRFAYSEALKRPDSPRAQYELAHTLIVATHASDDTPLAAQARELLEKTAGLPDSGISAWQALIYLNAKEKRPIDPRWWEGIIKRLHEQVPSKTDVNAVIFLYQCQIDGQCPVQPQEMMETFVAALEGTHGDLNLTSAYAEFASRVLDDGELATRLAREVVSARPTEPVYRGNLVRLLILNGDFDAAESEISALAKLNRVGSLDSLLASLTKQLADAREAAKSQPASAESDAGAMPVPSGKE